LVGDNANGEAVEIITAASPSVRKVFLEKYPKDADGEPMYGNDKHKYMKYIMIHEQDGDYLLVIAHEMDCHGNWMANEVQSFQTLEQLQGGLMGIMNANERFVIRAPSQFSQLAEDLGLQLVAGEWGRL
jgi:hypothetical protein